ncbi:MAG TPA: DUF692 domain-containing protein [Planctomycetota bacterium]|nr:DUF692 domain-containing protein [Planctomycetota bacterium]
MPSTQRIKRAAGNRFGLPNLGVGVGLRTTHYAHILGESPAVDWFEVISENHMQTAGRPLHVLDRIAERYPVVMHGVSLSIGSTDRLDREYLRELVALRDRCHAPWVSDHLCWTGVAGTNAHDLLPMPYTREALRHVVARVKSVQDALGAPLFLENPSTYVGFAASTMSEWDFLAELCERSGCGLMLDVNNIYVSSRNHGFAIADYLDGVPWDRVVQFHVSGHADNGTHCVDTHVGPVPDPVWAVFADAWKRSGGASVLLEWDAEIPPFDVVHRDALRCLEFIGRIERRARPQAVGA